jgi:hypothetical protein
VAVALALGSCTGEGKSTATASYPRIGIYISVERVVSAARPGAERRVVLHRPKQSAATFDLPPEPGPPLRLNLYGEPISRVFLKDRLGVYALDVRTAQLDPVAGEACACGHGTFRGSFDQDDRQVWRFIPSRERPEREVD